MYPKRVLCVCKGNTDRSCFMAKLLLMLLRGVGLDSVRCESAGILPTAAEGKPASPFAVVAAERIRIDLSKHKSKHVDSLRLAEYDLVVCVDDAVAAALMKLEVPIERIYNVQVSNPWPAKSQRQYDQVTENIVVAMYWILAECFSAEK